MARLFGTDGVRGVVDEEITAKLAYKLGRAGASVLTVRTRHKPGILVGMDTRQSGPLLEAALVNGIRSTGAEAVCLGIIPTPAVACLTRYYGMDAGIVISASHNPYEFNGIKFFDSRGYKLPDSIEDEIEELVLSDEETETGELVLSDSESETGGPIRSVKEGISLSMHSHTAPKHIHRDACGDYLRFLKNTITGDLKGFTIALDCANGASYETAPALFSDLGAEVITINNTPDGTNINRGCGSTHISGLKELVLCCNADVGFAFDGDADRVLAVDECGNTVDGDQIMAVVGLALKQKGVLEKDTIVATVMSNLGLELMTRENGIKLIRADVGDRYVLEEMLNKGYVFGGEQSGHIIFREYNTTGDGLLTALQLLSVIKSAGQTLSKMTSVMGKMPQILKNARITNSNKYRYMEDKQIARLCREIGEEFYGRGRVLIRPSGTEPLVRIMIEGENQEYISKRADELAALIEERLG